jgi:pre-rRNA-processing protein IPI1
MGKAKARAAARSTAKPPAAAAKTRQGVGFTSGPTKHRTGKTLGGGVEFAKKRLKVGRKVAKHANETDSAVRSKRIRLAAQNLQSVGGDAANEGTRDEDAASARGTPLNELLNQCGHYAVKTRCDGLSGLLEVCERYPGAVRGRAGDVIERVGERLADGEREARRAARECLRRGVVPALGVEGLAPFAKTLILYAGAALTHVADGVRRDAPAALDALLEAAPTLVAAHAPASTLGHLGELLRRGDDGGVGSGSSAQRGVGSQKPTTRLALLRSCRRFLETLAEVQDGKDGDRGGASSTSSTTTTFVWGEEVRRGATTRSIGSIYAERSRRAPASVLAATTANEESEDAGGRITGESRSAVRANAKRLVELAMSVWDDAAQTFTDERGVDIERVRVMAQSMACARLALSLADGAEESEIFENGGGGASTAVSVIPEIARRTLGIFPSTSPASVAEKQDISQTREAMVDLNFETCRFLLGASSSVAHEALAQHLAPGVMDALPHVLARALQYVASALRGSALDGGAMGEDVPTPDEAYGDVLALAGDALVLPAWCFSASVMGSACADLLVAVTETWERAVAEEDIERITQCVALLTDTLPEEARQGYFRVPVETAAGWVRHIPRVLWAFKHENPVATQKLLSLLHDIAARNPPGSPLADVLSACEAEMAVLYFMIPPVGSPEGAKSRPGPFARLPFASQCAAVRLVGVLPTLTQPMIRALVKMCLDVDRVNEELCVIAIEAMQANALAAPLELTMSFYATLLVGAAGVEFLDKSSKRDVAAVEEKSWSIARRANPSAAAALVAFSDADAPWTGASLASTTLKNMWSCRVEKGDVNGATRTASGFVSLVACAAEFAQSVSKQSIDDDIVSGAIPDMFAWFILRVEDGKGVDVDVAWRALRAAPSTTSGPVARAVVASSKASVALTDRALVFVRALITETTAGLIEIPKDELRDVVRAMQRNASALNANEATKRARALDVHWNVAFGESI